MLIEDITTSSAQLKLSRQNSYLLSVSQVNGNALQQQILMLFNSKYQNNQIKKLIKSGSHVIETLRSIFYDNNFERIYKIVKKVNDSFINVCNHIIQELEKQKIISNRSCKCKSNNLLNNENNDKKFNKTKHIDRAMTQAAIQIEQQQQKNILNKKNKLGGISIYNESYLRNMDNPSQVQQKFKKIKDKINNLQLNEKEYKKNLFDKMKSQLKAVQQQVYSPIPDQISSFLVFQRKFLQTFNHLSHSQSIDLIVKYLENSQKSATQLIHKSQDMTQQISKFKSQMQILMNDAKAKNKDRNQQISTKFQQILRKFIQKRIGIFQQTKKQLNHYKQIFDERQSKKIQIGTQTSCQQFATLKNYEQKINEMQNKFKIKQQQKQISFKQLLIKNDNQKNVLYAQISQNKIAIKKLTEQCEQLKTQNKKLKNMLAQRKEKLRSKQQITIKQIQNNQNQMKFNVNQNEIGQQIPLNVYVVKEKRASRLSNFSKKSQRGKTPQNKKQVQRNHLKPEFSKFVSIAEIQQENKLTTYANIEQQQKSQNEMPFLSFNSQKQESFKKQLNQAKSSTSIKSKRFVVTDNNFMSNKIKQIKKNNNSTKKIFNKKSDKKNNKIMLKVEADKSEVFQQRHYNKQQQLQNQQKCIRQQIYQNKEKQQKQNIKPHKKLNQIQKSNQIYQKKQQCNQKSQKKFLYNDIESEQINKNLNTQAKQNQNNYKQSSLNQLSTQLCNFKKSDQSVKKIEKEPIQKINGLRDWSQIKNNKNFVKQKQKQSVANQKLNSQKNIRQNDVKFLKYSTIENQKIEQAEQNMEIFQAFSISYRLGHLIQNFQIKSNQKNNQSTKLRMGRTNTDINAQNYHSMYIEDSIKNKGRLKNSNSISHKQYQQNQNILNKHESQPFHHINKDKRKHILQTLSKQKQRCFSTDQQLNQINLTPDSFFQVKGLFKDYEGLHSTNYCGNMKVKKKIARQLQIQSLISRTKKQNPLKYLKQFNQNYIFQKNKYNQFVNLRKVQKKKLQFQNVYRKIKSKQQTDIKALLPQIKIKQIY